MGAIRRIDDLACAQPEDGVSRGRPGLRRMQGLDHVGHGLDRPIINREQHIAACEPRPGRGSAFRDVGNHHALRPLYPQHAVFHLVEARSRQNIGHAEAQQRRDDQDR